MAHTRAELQKRAECLAQVTKGKPEWYATRKALTAAECVAGVAWNGTTNAYEAAHRGGLVQSGEGTWAMRQHGTQRAANLTKAECEAAGLKPGPGND